MKKWTWSDLTRTNKKWHLTSLAWSDVPRNVGKLEREAQAGVCQRSTSTCKTCKNFSGRTYLSMMESRHMIEQTDWWRPSQPIQVAPLSEDQNCSDISLVLSSQGMSQAPQHLRSSEARAICDGGFARQSICSDTSLDPGMSRTLHQVIVELWHVSVWLWFIDKFAYTRLVLDCVYAGSPSPDLGWRVWSTLLSRCTIHSSFIKR